MNQESRNSLGKKITESAIYFGKLDLSKDQVMMQIDVMVQHFGAEGIDKIIWAIDRYVLDPKNKFFFSPATLRPYLNPELSTEAKAIEAATRIRSAITKFGYPTPGEARAYIGELGWKVVERAGGWNYICENHGVDLNPLTFFAQSRDSAKSLQESASIGEFDRPIGIEFKEQKHQDMIINDKKRDQALALLNHLKNNEMPK
jgi:hypothetical protein